MSADLLGFCAFLDAGYIRYVSQPLQHLAVRDRATRLGGRVSFYTTEAPETVASHMVLRGKLREKPRVDGFVFFRLYQFCYGDRLRLDVLRAVLDAGYEVHFAREPVSLRSPQELEGLYPLLSTVRHLERRDVAGSGLFDAARSWTAPPLLPES